MSRFPPPLSLLNCFRKKDQSSRDVHTFGRDADRLGPFLAQIEENEDGCWLWQGSVTEEGYGRTSWGEYTHRFAYRIYVGPIRQWHQVHHLCGVHDCCQPSHLLQVTKGEHQRIHQAGLGLSAAEKKRYETDDWLFPR